MSIDNYIVTADLSFNSDVRAVENIDGNRFAVGGGFTQVTDSTGEVKDCSYCGIFNKEGELLVPINVNHPGDTGDNVEAIAYLGNDKLAIGGYFTEVNRGPLGGGELVDTSHCAIFTTTDGTLDVSFGDISANNFAKRMIKALAYLGNDKLAVGGNFVKVNKGPQAGGASVDTSSCAIFTTTDGTLDVSFNFSTAFDPETGLVRALVNLENNRLAVGGEFLQLTDSNGDVVDTSYCVIVNSQTGAFDTSFNFNTRVRALVNLENNRLAAGGNFTQLTDSNGDVVDTSYCVIVNSQTGAFDTSFNFNDIVVALADLGNDRLAVGGEFTDLDGDSTTRLAIVDPNSGSLIKQFRNIDSAPHLSFLSVESLADLGNNHLVVGGSFVNMHNDCPGAKKKGTPCQNLAILNRLDTILQLTCQQVTGEVSHISCDVPTPPDYAFTEHKTSKAAQEQARATGQKTIFYAKGKYLVKKPNFCLDIENQGFNNFKLSKKIIKGTNV